MKILYITSGSGWGGASVALLNLIKELKNKGHDIRVLFPDSNGRFEKELKKVDIKCYHSWYSITIIPNSRYKLKNCLKSIILYFGIYITKIKIKMIISDYKPDIVHTNVGPLDIALDICKKNKIPHVWHQREYQDLDFGIEYYKGFSLYAKRLKEKGNYNIAITKGVFDHWQLQVNKDIIIYDGVFSGKIEKREHSRSIFNYPYFLFVGRIDDAKQPIDAIKAFVRICDMYPDHHLLLAGPSIDPSYISLCKTIIKAHNLNSRVVFLGQRDDIYELMCGAIALLVTSRFEGFGFITAEAMFNNCLVIGRDTAGTKEQFDIGKKTCNREIGLRYNTIDELVYNMQRAINEDLSEMREWAYQTVISNYHSSINAKRVESYYYKILKHYKNGIK